MGNECAPGLWTNLYYNMQVKTWLDKEWTRKHTDCAIMGKYSLEYSFVSFCVLGVFATAAGKCVCWTNSAFCLLSSCIVQCTCATKCLLTYFRYHVMWLLMKSTVQNAVFLYYM